MRPEQVQQVLALEAHLDRHDQLLRQSKAVYATYGTEIEDLDFQNKLVKEACAAKRMWCAELATGVGKSVIAAKIAAERLPDGPIIYVSPSAASIGDTANGVINKFARTFHSLEHHAVLGPTNELSRANDVSFMTPRVLVSMLQREPDRIGNLLRRASCLIVDEAHHFPADTNNELRVYGALYEAADKYVRDGLTVAMTGTWTRLDRKRVMGVAKPDARLTVQDAVNLRRCAELYAIQVITDVRAKSIKVCGDLYDFHLSGTERLAYLQGVVDCIAAVYRRYPVPFAAFARSVSDAIAIAARLNEQMGFNDQRGLIVLTGSTPLSVRLRAVNEIAAGTRVGYITCAVGEEAIDIPGLEVVHMIRRTRSYARNAQAIGRALRVFLGKPRALVIDYQTVIEGVQNRFLGLSCDDMLDSLGSAIQPQQCVNGGPLVAQKTYPQGVLVGMTMGEERAVICVHSGKAKRQMELLELARTGAPRPGHKTPLGKALSNYTAKSSKIYDPAFTKTLFSIQPGWVPDYNAKGKKQALLKLARAQEARPKKGSLGQAAKRYLAPSSKSYDESLATEIRALCPHWFNSTVAEYKQQLLTEAAQMTRPSGQQWNRIRCLMRTDADFREKLLKIRPDWTTPRAVRVATTKDKLRKLARTGAPKPGGSLGDAFSWYCTRPSSNRHDAKFTTEMRALRPEWFESTASRTKQELLERARMNQPRPKVKGSPKDRKLYWKLWGYTRVSHKTYDPAFTAELFMVRPDWRWRS